MSVQMKNVVVTMKHERTDEECGSDDEAWAFKWDCDSDDEAWAF